MNKKINNEELLKIKSEYLEGKSLRKLCVKTSLSFTTLKSYLEKIGTKFREPINKDTIYGRKRQYIHDYDYFENIDSEEKAYWLGFIYADGYVCETNNSMGITLGIKDINHLEKFKKNIKSNNEIKVYNTSINSFSSGAEYCRIILTSKKTKYDLIKQGVIIQKTNKIIPPVLQESLMRHFIRGYFDGNGGAWIEKNGLYVISFDGSEIFIKWIIDYLYKNIENISPIKTITKRFDTENCSSSIKYSAKQARNILKFIYDDCNVFLDRKYKIYKQIDK